MRHFSHELKSVLRDFAVPLALPSLIVAGSLYFWTAKWAMAVAPPGASPGIVRSLIEALVHPAWPYLEKALCFGGWAIPFLILKNADLHDTLATWKTRPVSRQTVFTTRFLALVGSYVALPAAVTWFTCRISWPEIAAEQAAMVAGGGFGMILLGAFAAMIAPGRRGIAILGGLAATAYVIAAFGPDTANSILNGHVLHIVSVRDYSDLRAEYTPLSGEWMTVAALLTMVALVTPWIVLRIMRRGRHPRVFPWFAVTILLGVAFQAALFISPARRTRMRGPTLPLVSVELKDWKNRPTPQINAMNGGLFLGAGNLRLPSADLRIAMDDFEPTTLRMWQPEQSSYFRAQMTGIWETDTMCGRIERHFQDSRAGLNASWYANEWGAKPLSWEGYWANDLPLRPLAMTLGVPTVKIWTALNCAHSATISPPTKPNYVWADSTTFRQKPQLVGFDFGIPFDDGKPGQPCVAVTPEEVFRGKTIHFRVNMQLARDLSPSVWLRVPVLRGGEKITNREMVRIEPAEPGDRRFYARGAFHERPLDPWNKDCYRIFSDDHSEYLLFNAARGEGVFLVSDDSIYYGAGALTLPKNAPTLTDEWIAGAEIVVLKYRSEPVVLPVEGSLKVAD